MYTCNLCSHRPCRWWGYISTGWQAFAEILAYLFIFSVPPSSLNRLLQKCRTQHGRTDSCAVSVWSFAFTLNDYYIISRGNLMFSSHSNFSVPSLLFPSMLPPPCSALQCIVNSFSWIYTVLSFIMTAQGKSKKKLLPSFLFTSSCLVSPFKKKKKAKSSAFLKTNADIMQLYISVCSFRSTGPSWIISLNISS